ncbi:HAD family hydrolase [Balneolales bacterium ANBcel1]|nr:HAD family hydrolase [Balneolales bacterium ANBcel1]
MNLAYLFDIDGTLLKVKNRVNRVVIQEVLNRLGVDREDVRTVDFAGRTDRAIFTDLLDGYGDGLFDQVKRHYISALDASLRREDVHVLHGVESSLRYLAEKSAWTGLLTGNFARAAEIKISRTGLDNHFAFGAFGDDHADRNDLPPNAMKALESFSGKAFRPADLVIIGDTPRDILCARSHGSPCVAVSTGHYTREQLRSYRPDALLNSLEEFPDWDRQFRRSRMN